MDILSVIGLALGLFAVFGGAVLEGIHITAILVPTAAIIVFGGTIGAVLLHSSGEELRHLKECLPSIFKPPPIDARPIMEQILEMSKIARRDGMLALDEKVKEIENPILSQGIGLLVDGVSAEDIRGRLEIAVGKVEERYQNAARLWEAAGGFAPTVGILGAVLGLIHVMQSLDDPSKIGGGIAVAFVATVYGVAFANLVCLPIGAKMKARMRAEAALGEMIIEGVVAMAEGQPTSGIEQTLVLMIGQAEGEEKAAA